MDRIDGLPALVLLSGGLDSVAALHWARDSASEVRAISFRYGQVNQEAEVEAAGRIASKRGIKHDVLVLGEAVRGLMVLAAPATGVDGSGISRANLHARNPILLSCAAGFAARIPWSDFVIVIGATKDDAAFPDCRPEFMTAATETLRLSLNGIASVEVIAPWLNHSKADVLRWAMNRRSSLEDVRESVSCYLGTRCGLCDPCTLRAAAFAANGIEDQCSTP